MDFNLPFNDESWLYNDNSSNHYNNEPLQEPVPFEDFKFSFGINPGINATPNIEDFPPPIISPHKNTSSSNEPTSLDPLYLQQEPFNFAANTVLDEDDQKAFSSFLDAFFLDPNMLPHLNEDSLDQQQQQNQEDQEENRRNSILQSLDEQKKLHQTLNLIASLPPTNNATTADLMMNDPTVAAASSSKNKGIVTSASEDDNQLQTIYLHSSDSINNSLYKHYHQQQQKHQQLPLSKKRSSPSAESTSSASSLSRNKKARTTKELLTEEEKRANHIASEQKRRSTIRNGFKDLTDLVPTLKNINNSKSTVLFKAVDFIRYLEKRNKHLRDKVGSLELRVEVEGRMTGTSLTRHPHQQQQKETSPSSPPLPQQPQQQQQRPPSAFNPIKNMSYSPPTTPPSPIKKPFTIINTPLPKTHFVAPLSPIIDTSHGNNSNKNKRMRSNSATSSTSANSNTSSSMSSSDHTTNQLMKGLPANARNALLAHKTQQKQLLLLQEQLQMHQRLIAQQQEMKEKSLSQHRQQQVSSSASLQHHSPKNKLPPILVGGNAGQYDAATGRRRRPSSILTELEDTAISAP
ncbi:helix-loop-helix DNA-binding domain protein [Mucor ambiguus]|uniref:Helix-loop-helix DNA-binding domain protein n=1 Tax=Mucor ambiguus TaxID=91626 RepID=A0A0C9LPL1_9FUNG|nr:helix-loop-helix DNA-binding domain protein [Mucor ambiguus]